MNNTVDAIRQPHLSERKRKTHYGIPDSKRTKQLHMDSSQGPATLRGDSQISIVEKSERQLRYNSSKHGGNFTNVLRRQLLNDPSERFLSTNSAMGRGYHNRYGEYELDNVEAEAYMKFNQQKTVVKVSTQGVLSKSNLDWSSRQGGCGFGPPEIDMKKQHSKMKKQTTSNQQHKANIYRISYGKLRKNI